MSPDANEIAASLPAQARRRLAAEPDLAARFDELATKAISDGPGYPGACGRNPFWIRDIDCSSLSGAKMFEHAAYTVRLDRTRAQQVAA